MAKKKSKPRRNFAAEAGVAKRGSSTKLTEPEWTTKVCAAMRARNASVFSIVASCFQIPGWPDRILSHTYTGVCLLEFKGKRTKVELDQAAVIRELRRADPYHTYIVRTYDNEFVDGATAGLEDECGVCFRIFEAHTPEAAAEGLIRTIQELRKERFFSHDQLTYKR